MPITLSQIDQWIKLVQEDKLETCLEEICGSTEKEIQSYQTTVFNLNARLSELKKEQSQGIIDQEKENHEKNKIRVALLEILLELKNETLEDQKQLRTVLLADDPKQFLELLKANLPAGRYSQLECISYGDYCLVYKAVKDEGTEYEQPVAIKVFKNISLIDQENRAELEDRFSKSKRYSMKDGIITILNDDLQGLPHYYIMPYINGMTLKDYLKQGWPMQPREIKSFLLRIAQALLRGHRDNMVHLSLRPSNIMIDKYGDWEPQIFPFQVIRFNLTQRNIKRIKQIVAYWSPEQINGDEEELTAKSDQYALGLVAFELFKLSPFFDGKTVLEALQKRVQYRENPKILREELQQTSCPEKMITVIEKMMAEDPTKRYRDMKQVINEIESIPFSYEEVNEDFQLLVDSFNRCRKEESFYSEFYTQFFKKRKGAEALFKKRFEERKAAEPNMEVDFWTFQHHMLDLAIDRMLVFQTNPEMVKTRMKRLVSDHVSKYKTLAEDFPIFLDCLRDTLQHQDPETWKDRPEVLKKTWALLTKDIVAASKGKKTKANS